MNTRTNTGGRIDRSKPLAFTFNGMRHIGFKGDTLASALLASGIHLVGRSFKLHRPRGILTAGAEEPNAIVQLGTGAATEPNARATQVELFDGLEAESVNVWPSVEFDLNALNGLASRLFVAGFYHKTFMGPKSFWRRLYEPMIRRAAGWGRAPAAPDPDRYDRMNAHCDVLVVGTGPAGLAAALTAARTGARVIVVDEQAEAGGALLGENRRIDAKPADAWIADVLEELGNMPEVRVLTRTTAFGYYDQNYICLVERCTDHLGPGAPSHLTRQRVWHVRAKRVVLATGAHERPLVFPGNDRPGIMLAAAVRTYVTRYGAVPGKRAVVFTNNDAAYETALVLRDAGVTVAALIDSRREVSGGLPDAVRAAGIPVMAGHAVAGTSGRKHLARVEVEDMDSAPMKTIACDLLAVSGGYSPAVHLFSQSMGKLAYNDARACFVPGAPVQKQACAGSLTGVWSVKESLEQGFAAGAQMAAEAGFEGETPTTPSVEEPDPGGLEPLWLAPAAALPERSSKAYVDFQNDTSAADILLAAREGFESVEHMKRFTLAGFGTDQGKTSNVNALAILSDALARPIPETGTTTFRPPYTPVTFGALAGPDVGALLDPERHTAMQEWHMENGAVFEDVGQWKRPWYYPKQGEDMDAAVGRECLAVRNGVGMLDASTLGKIDIVGPDAAEFLNRIYTNSWLKLGTGRVRYALMCGEDGMVFDDGTTTRLGDNHFFMTTTTGGAGHVLDWLEEWLQTEWPYLKVYCTSVTEQWAVASLAGPRAGELLSKLATDLNFAPDAFPHMSMVEAPVARLPARVFRISFTGELSFEINVPWSHGKVLWEAIMTAGEEFGITPYGTETMHVLRAEKGFIIVGQDTDGTQTPEDLGMQWIVSKKKDFIGRRSFARADTARADRKQLVGLLTEDPEDVLPEGAQLVAPEHAGKEPPVPMIGHVTSSYMSAALGHSIALAMVERRQSRMGESILVPLENKTIRARIADPVFYDKEGSRRDG